MPSIALLGLRSGLDEIRSLRKLSPVRASLARGAKALTARAHGRATVVLLSGHYERYIRAVNEEALYWLNAQSITSTQMPVAIRLRHSKATIDALVGVNWDHREKVLTEFASTDSLLWNDAAVSPLLDHSKVLAMKSPQSNEVRKFYLMYGIDDIFSKITRKPHRRQHIWFKLQEMVDKRNNIAHGDFTTEALPSEITSYIDAVERFCEAADKVFSRELKKIAGSTLEPW